MSSSFQSLVESGECGATNPVVDLARQFTQSTNDPAIQDLASAANHHPQNDQAPIGPSAADLLTQSRPDINPFDMEALVEQMKQMEELFEKAVKDDVKKEKGTQLPLISNPTSGIEEEFWSEALQSSGVPEFTLFSPDTSMSGNNWADEYFRTLENTTAPFDTKEDSDKQDDEHLLYRNAPLDDFDSFFSVDSSFASSNFFKSLPIDVNAESKPAEVMPTESFNLTDLVSDQEERLMEMLLENASGEVRFDSNAPPPLTDEQLDQLLNSKDDITTTNSSGITNTAATTKPMESDFKIPDSLLTEPTQEKFFYENQFDDMEFWMKLAEDWESSNESDLANLRTDNKPVRIQEPLEELINPDHAYHYRFVDENPFLEQEEAKKEAATDPDYIGQGLAKLEVGDIPAAILYFEAAAKTQPESVRAWSLLGSAQAKNENDRKAIAAMKRCLALEPNNLEALMCLAISFTNESMPNEACHALQEWLRSNEKYRQLVADAEAAKLSEPNTEQYLGPTPLSKRWGAGAASGNVFNNGFFDTVRECYIKAAQLSPNDPDPDVQCGLGALFNLSGEYGKAADCFRTAVSVRQSDHTLWNRLGATLANGGNSEEAMSAYREALVRYPGYIRARYNLGISCVLLGATREAVDHLLGVLNLQTAGTKSVQAGTDSTLQELMANPNQVTSANVWNTLRSALISLGRNDLCELVDQRALDKLNAEFGFKLSEEEPNNEAPPPSQQQDS